ncbi:MAG: hypothetical protein EOP10_03460 [Proteobacteria bacterium]|nr:MAG: hypothetical protein EOP10_03460 [Pseudomonadota bacterium]
MKYSSKLFYAIKASAAAFVFVLSGTTLKADAEAPNLSPPPACESGDSGCLIITVGQGYELSDFGAIDLIGVAEDSRCPVDVFCIWAGQVQVELKHSFGSDAAKFQLGLGEDLTAVWFDPRTGKELILEEVWPAPNLANPINKPYQIKLRIVDPNEPVLEQDSSVQQAIVH